MGRARYETVALTPDRQVVAQSTLALSLGDNPNVYQWGTFVHREHRGHRLGLATKAVNLRAVQAARSDLTLVITQNGETNDYMVAINERMGFRPIEVVGRVRQAPLTRAAPTLPAQDPIRPGDRVATRREGASHVL